jgi:predicted RNA-binding protein Jag
MVHPMSMDARELIEKAVAKLAGDTATVRTHEDEHGAVFEIFSTTNALLVGKQQATINSMRTLAKALGYRDKHRIKVVLREYDEEA